VTPSQELPMEQKLPMEHRPGKEGLATRFGFHARRQNALRPGQRVVVAVSGGLDSTVLLHLMRFGVTDLGLDLRAAHFDHAMRPESRADAQWVAGLCGAWGVKLRTERATVPPQSEAQARDLRYTFLASVVAQWEVDWVLTAHHANDQAETVLFRAVRGAGLRGLAGIPSSRDGWLHRPLLPFWVAEIEEYADAHGLSWRDDATNRDLEIRRNVLRHTVLPLLEHQVAPGATRSLARLAEHAGRLGETVTGLAAVALASVTRHREPGRLVLDGPRVSAIPEAARAELLRAATEMLGVTLSGSGTRLALEVSGPSLPTGGRDLGGGLHLSRQYEDLVVELVGLVHGSCPVCLPAAGVGEGNLEVGGRPMTARWSPTVDRGHGEPRPTEAFFVRSQLDFPLSIREWRPGDRIQLESGTKKLKKVFQEARLPRWRRSRQPLLVDASERVLWVPGLSRSSSARPRPSQPGLWIAIVDRDPVTDPP